MTRGVRYVPLPMLGVAAAACAGGDISTTLPPRSEWPLTVTVRPCPEGGDCPPQFLVDDTPYVLSCGRIKPEFVSEMVVGTGAAEVREVQGVDPALFAAIMTTTYSCPPGSASAWNLAIGPNGYGKRPADFSRELCRVGDLSAEQRAAEGCAEP
jgi:hypothetical protein